MTPCHRTVVIFAGAFVGKWRWKKLLILVPMLRMIVVVALTVSMGHVCHRGAPLHLLRLRCRRHRQRRPRSAVSIDGAPCLPPKISDDAPAKISKARQIHRTTRISISTAGPTRSLPRNPPHTSCGIDHELWRHRSPTRDSPSPPWRRETEPSTIGTKNTETVSPIELKEWRDI